LSPPLNLSRERREAIAEGTWHTVLFNPTGSIGSEVKECRMLNVLLKNHNQLSRPVWKIACLKLDEKKNGKARTMS
jgi:hypothetical protein